MADDELKSMSASYHSAIKSGVGGCEWKIIGIPTHCHGNGTSAKSNIARAVASV
jgi:hypothetical protein